MIPNAPAPNFTLPEPAPNHGPSHRLADESWQGFAMRCLANTLFELGASRPEWEAAYGTSYPGAGYKEAMEGGGRYLIRSLNAWHAARAKEAAAKEAAARAKEAATKTVTTHAKAEPTKTVTTHDFANGRFTVCGPCARFGDKHYAWNDLVGGSVYQGVYRGAHRGKCETCATRRALLEARAEARRCGGRA